jgi:sulfur carrier protein ThiS
MSEINESFDERVARRLRELDINEQLRLLEMLDQRDQVMAMENNGDFLDKDQDILRKMALDFWEAYHLSGFEMGNRERHIAEYFYMSGRKVVK